MTNWTEVTKAGRRLMLLGGLFLAASACQDLQVDNLVDPDRERATSNPEDVQAFIGGAFYPTFYEALHDITQAISLFPTKGGEMTATMAGQGTLLQWEDLVEPGQPQDNGAVLSLGNGPHGPRMFWADVTSAATVAYDGLQILNEGMEITEGGQDVTARARAFSKLIQGWAWGYLGLMFDEAHVLHESVDIPSDPDGLWEVTLESLVPYEEVVEAALSSLDEAIQVAQQNPGVVHFPSVSESPLWFGTADPMSNTLFIEMANTLAARILVLAARSPEQRTQVDWNRVLSYTANGLTSDVEFQLSTSRESELLLWAQNNTASGERNQRWDYRAIGPADQSGAYQAWISSPIQNRDRFEIVTPDRRITGETPTSNGSYTYYRADDNGFVPDRGRYLYSAYQWRRHAIRNNLTGDELTGYQQGRFPLISADENNLLRAEALLRTGDAAGAAELINITRTRPQTIDGVQYDGLPPVTANGVPEVDGECVPRLDSGACGDLLTAIRYERMIELAATDVFRGYADSRGWGTLEDGHMQHFPVPGNILDQYGMSNYTYGGVGNEWSATYGPATLP